jgi:hypothetical protein
MIQYLQHNQIDFEKWDLCIDGAINGIIYPYSFYLNQVSPGWDALIYEDYKAVMPLPVKKRMGVSYLIQPPFIQQLGVFAEMPVSDELLKMFIDAIPSRFKHIDINMNTFNQIRDSRFQKRVTYELDLLTSYDQIVKGYSSQTIRNLKKSQKEKVYIYKNNEPDIIIESFRKYKGKGIRHWKDSQYNTLKHLIYSGIYRGDTEIYSAYDNKNTFCAGIVFFTSHNKSILIFSGSTPVARSNGAMTAIIDKFISDHQGQHLTLDFEGSSEKNLARFYAGFGSKECVFLQLQISNFPAFIKPIINLYFWLKKIKS